MALTFMLPGPARGAGEPRSRAKRSAQDLTARANEVTSQRHLVEVGAFLGVLIPSSSHELFDEHYKHQPLRDVGLDVGLRLSYLPLPFIGAELEGAVMPTSTDVSGTAALLWAVRGHVIAQYPARLAPFIVAGGGLMGIQSEKVTGLGDDQDAVFHWGLGLKWYATDWLALRIDGRHIPAGAEGLGGTAHHFEALFGAAMVIGWRKPAPPDTDGDGITDDKDACPNQPAKTADGCPPRDTDGDGITDDKDRCPGEPETRNGFEDDDGCPDTLPQKVKRFTGAIKGIRFATGKAVIVGASFATLDQAGAVLKEYPALKLLIRGHTDSTGSAEINTRLSLARAQAVKDYFVKKGIAEDRLAVEGVGPAEPVGNNKTRAGRAENRRTEFKLQ